MASKIRARTNHYETLGLAPTAATDEIAKAFARETGMFRPHAFGGITELCVAYDTLRDPIKRRAYDASLGLEREPRPFAPRERPNVPPAPLAQQTPADAMPRFAPQIGEDRARYLAEEERLHVEAAPIEWKRTGAILGGILVAACVLGGVAGWWSAHDIGEAAPPKPDVSVPLQPAKPPAPSTALFSTPVPNEVHARPVRPKRTATALAVAPPAIAEEQPQERQTEQSEPGLGASEEAAADAPPAAPVAAAMPLPNKLIARTIQRIGYACGAVASTSPVEGEAPGVFKVTCTSGQSYQASPVNGRYRFRRLSGN